MSADIAIIGAGGFVGVSLVEALALAGSEKVRAIVRAYRSLAGLSRFGSAISFERADAEDADSLCRAIAGCKSVINLTTGTPNAIIRSTKAIHQACLQANVPKLIHLSSAVVYGEVESPSINDDSPVETEHWMPYARAKAAAEQWLRRNASAACQLIVLRPGIVWGVRSPHTLSIARALVDKSAYLVGGGHGIFNSIYITNLIECLLACHRHEGSAAGFYNVADRERISWRDFYATLGGYLGCDINRLPIVSAHRFPVSPHAVLEYVQSLPWINSLYHRLKKQVPDVLRAKIKRVLAGRPSYEDVSRTYDRRPRVERELWHLQRTKHKLPSEKFRGRFGETPAVSFQDGMLRTVHWLRFLGYTAKLHEPEGATA